MTLFKICGLQTAEDAIFARKCGATFLGFVFVNGVRRELSLPNAAELIEKYRSVCGDGGPSLVGLFADQPIDMVNEIIGKCGLDYVQLCGGEKTDYWAKIESKVIKQIRIDDLEDPEKLDIILRQHGYGLPGENIYRFKVPEPVTPLEETLQRERSKGLLEFVVEFPPQN